MLINTESSVLEQFSKVRKKTGSLCSVLNKEDFTPQVAIFASPPKWHIAHTSWFFEAFILKKYYPDYKEFDPEFSYLFNSYYNNEGERLARENRGSISRPAIEQVFDFRDYVDTHISQLLENTSSKEIEELVILGLNHEQQHQELLLTDIKYNFYNNPLYPAYDPNFSEDQQVDGSNEFIKINEGIYEIGYEGSDFCYDNELNRHRVFVEKFEIRNSLVTNEEYLEFMQAGGYEDFNLWLDEGWSWIKENNINSPLYWLMKNDSWYRFSLSGLEEVDPKSSLSHISFYEASAFATWKNCRLATEQEWEVASGKFHWGERWEWTNSAYLAYPGFKKAEGAIGEYNGKFMINQMVLRGASIATPEGHSRDTYRNFFHPNERWQFNGIRLAR